MTNYEKAMELLKQERAEKHRTFNDTGIICITRVLVLDNNKFRWYISLGNDYDKNSDIYLDTQVEGRKNNYSAQILSNDDSLSSVHSSTGSYR